MREHGNAKEKSRNTGTLDAKHFWNACPSLAISEYVPIAGHLGSLNTLFIWSREQMEAMQLDCRKVLLDANYGHGKTLIIKSKALQLAASLKRKDDNAKVFFVSFTASYNKVTIVTVPRFSLSPPIIRSSNLEHTLTRPGTKSHINYC